jgi:hypothetical protein
MRKTSSCRCLFLLQDVKKNGGMKVGQDQRKHNLEIPGLDDVWHLGIYLLNMAHWNCRGMEQGVLDFAVSLPAWCTDGSN